ncbi:DUF1835 domain-containing protein [Paenibacillus profundus]|uniref:DUF1835 domain-containing protein n=1 Tax=Paenibacillus profundus TaxID=1173085 RepID=A0ABS8YBB2_9BACL|nr:DUF1835 domain-containing protein [Paenibacillus profundus]MCE5167770.1 DUF1835 domain-containing protein [Paenibacillus profundus]
MIHIVNGDCTADRLRPLAKTHWNEDVWVYSELLTEGPVYSKFERYLAYRALQLVRMCALPAAIYLQKSNEQERTWKSDIQSATHIALWFEHDLFDITMLLRLVDRLTRENPNAELYWIDIASAPEHDRYQGFGVLHAEQLLPYRDQAMLLTAEVKDWLQGAWLAYTSPNPLRLVQWVYESQDIPAPYCAITEGLRFHLSRYPSTLDGLGVAERLTLEAVSQGQSSFIECFRYVGDRLPEYGLGDLQYWGYLRRMTDGTHPLLCLAPDSDPLPEPLQPPLAGAGRLELTSWGRQTLAGEVNWALAGGYGRWLGGAFITKPLE